jgi:DNA-directed RNA polymerase subunit K/omega
MVPVYEIINYSGNRYLLTKAIMKRAREINFVGDEDLENYNGKIASLSLRQILNNEIKYTLMEDEKKLKNI